MQPLRLRAAGTLLVAAVLLGCDARELPPDREASAPPLAAEHSERPPPLEIGHTLGAEDAPVLVTEFSDFGCTACAEFALQSFPALRREFVRSGLVRWRFVPIRQGFYRGDEAAMAAECAARQGEFWQMHDALSRGQREWQRWADPRPVLARYAEEILPDTAAFGRCYREREAEATLRLNDMVALSMGVHGIPVFLVGGQRVIGALDAERFAEILRAQVAAQPEDNGER